MAAEVRVAQHRLAFEQLAGSLWLSILVPLPFVALLIPVFHFQPMAQWVGGLWGVTLARAGMLAWYRRTKPTSAHMAGWATLFWIGAASAGAAWSLGAWPLLAGADAYPTAMLVITLLAVAAFGSTALSTHLPSAVSFIALTLAPVAIHMISEGEPLERVVGFAVATAAAVLMGSARRMNRGGRRLIGAEIELSAAVADASHARSVAEASNQAKSLFLANTGHELRTPLNGILGMAELLAGGALGAEQRDRVGVIQNSGRTLLAIVDDILDFSDITADRLGIEPVDFDLRQTVEEVFTRAGRRAHANGLEISCALEPGTPEVVCGDPVRLRQILFILADNAVKFTPAGAVRVRVRAEAATGELTPVRFEVTDTGIGFSMSVRAGLFQPFMQADTSSGRRFGGAGLGLSIAYRLVGLMGGTLDTSSIEGVGSTFWFTIPFRQAARPLRASQPAVRPELERSLAEAPQAKAAAVGTAPRRILLAEDQLVNQALTISILRDAGYQVDAVADGQAAVEARFRSDYDLVLMDCQMPVHDGFGAAMEIRRRENGRRVPIVAVTASTSGGDRERCLAAGMDDYLPKPFTRKALLAVVERWAPTADVPAPTPRAPTRADPPPAGGADVAVGPDEVFKLERLTDIVGDDVASLAKYMALFESSARPLIGELATAVVQRDQPTVKSLAHRLRGSCAVVGAVEMEVVCRQLESAVRGGDWPAADQVMQRLESALARASGFVARYGAGVPA